MFRGPMHFRHHLHYLELREPFGISRSTFSRSDTFFVNLDGGWGEGTPSGFFGENEETVAAALDRIAAMDLPAPELVEETADQMAAEIRGFGAARAAVDIALHDRLGRRLGMPLHALFGRGWRADSFTSYTIGIAPADEMVRKVEEARAFRILKVKLGRDVEQDIAVMRQVRGVAGDRVLRVDANCGWTLEEALRAIPVLADLGVEYVEQPLPRGAVEEMRALRAKSPLPIYADEDAVTAADIPRLLGAVDGINIKLMKCGGFVEARRMLALARVHGLKVMLGGRIESSVGVTAAAHLAPWADSLDLDGNLLVTNDPFRGVRCDPDGRLHLADLPGLGVELRPEFAGICGA